jgi:hypothetical protein
MVGGFMMSAGRLSLLAATGVLLFAGASAQAADLGGDCCADLEERIAELEATTARKGNRKVSLEISGHINEAVMFWDDGAESNMYVVTNDSGRSRVRFKGDAKINGDWKAGYYLEIGFRNPRSDRVNQNNDDPDPAIDVRQSNWYVKSKTYGEVRVGFGNGASESITEINLANTKDIAKNADVEDFAAGFLLRAKGSTGAAGLSSFTWQRLVKDDFIQPGEGSRGNYIMYTTPEFAGFTASAAWGEDDFWDMALRYKGELGDFEIAGGIAYGQNSDTATPTMPCIVSVAGTGAADCHQFGGSLSVMHKPTGIFVTGAAGQFVDELISGAFAAGTNPDDESTFYSFQAGIEKKWLPLGKTTLYGEYFNFEGGANDRGLDAGDAINTTGVDAVLWNTEVEVIGGGIVQSIDSAAMSVYLTYRHYEATAGLRAEDGTGPTFATDLEDLDVVMSGAIIKF